MILSVQATRFLWLICENPSWIGFPRQDTESDGRKGGYRLCGVAVTFCQTVVSDYTWVTAKQQAGLYFPRVVMVSRSHLAEMKIGKFRLNSGGVCVPLAWVPIE